MGICIVALIFALISCLITIVCWIYLMDVYQEVRRLQNAVSQREVEERFF